MDILFVAAFFIEIFVSKQCRPFSDAAFDALVASKLGLHCLHNTLIWASVLIYVELQKIFFFSGIVESN